MSGMYDLKQCLLEAFSGQPEGHAQAEIYIWAILEGLSRTGWGKQWHDDVAEHPLRCMRGCTIPVGDTYFLIETNTQHHIVSPFCANCIAMVLYSQQVWLLPVVRYDAWDIREARPIRQDHPAGS